MAFLAGSFTVSSCEQEFKIWDEPHEKGNESLCKGEKSWLKSAAVD